MGDGEGWHWRNQEPDQAGPQDQGKEVSLYPEDCGEPLKDFEQRSDLCMDDLGLGSPGL